MKLHQLPLWLRQIVKFLSVGVLNTAIDLGVYLLLTRFTVFFGAHLSTAKAVSYSIGVLNSYFWNRAWTFRSRAGIRYTLLPFILVNLVGVGVNSGIHYLCLSVLRLPEIVAVIAATGITLVWNFIMSRLVFSRIRSEQPAPP